LEGTCRGLNRCSDWVVDTGQNPQAHRQVGGPVLNQRIQKPLKIRVPMLKVCFILWNNYNSSICPALWSQYLPLITLTEIILNICPENGTTDMFRKSQNQLCHGKTYHIR
jgi:hypothetical protein